jgi:hypothetical protein
VHQGDRLSDLYTDALSLQAGQGPLWPQGRSFGLSWSRDRDVLMFGGLLSIRYLTVKSSVRRWLLNDLWQFDAADNNLPWKLLGGAGLNTADQLMFGSTTFVEAVGQWPVPRMHAAGWVLAADNSAWMFGGLLGCCQASSVDKTVSQLSYELWAVRGDVTGAGQTRGATTGGLEWSLVTMGESDGFERPTFLQWPSARVAAITWVDTSGRFWLFGGFDTASKCDLDDLWVLDSSVAGRFSTPTGKNPRWLNVGDSNTIATTEEAKTEATGNTWPKARFGASVFSLTSGSATMIGGASLGRHCSLRDEFNENFSDSDQLSLNFPISDKISMARYAGLGPDVYVEAVSETIVLVQKRGQFISSGTGTQNSKTPADE